MDLESEPITTVKHDISVDYQIQGTALANPDGGLRPDAAPRRFRAWSDHLLSDRRAGDLLIAERRQEIVLRRV